MKKLKLDLKSIEADVEISDGYHTFDELYDHRITLYIALCKSKQDFIFHGDSRNVNGDSKVVWRSERHSDGTKYAGWFILGINRAWGKQITYHVPLERWSETEFAETLDHAPEWDKSTSQDVLERLKNL